MGSAGKEIASVIAGGIMDATTGSALISGLKALHDIVKANKNPEMMGQVLEIQSQVFALVNENQQLRSENANLKAQVAQKADCEIREDGAVWRKGDKRTQYFAGFCPNCFQSNNKLNKLMVMPDAFGTRICSICKFEARGHSS